MINSNGEFANLGHLILMHVLVFTILCMETKNACHNKYIMTPGLFF